MIVRTKSGNYHAENEFALLDFFGIKKNSVGIQKVTQDVELITAVPFIKEQRKENNEQSQDEFAQASFAWTLSTFDLDRFNERIDPHGWVFNRYLQNPVVEWAHRYDIPAIGKMENLTIDDAGLHGFVCFNPKEIDPFGWAIGQRVRAGVIRAGSVGFRVLEIEIPSKEDSKDGTSLIFRKQELLEFSICNVPANPYALAKAKEQLEMRNEKSDNAFPFWGNFLNFQHPC